MSEQNELLRSAFQVAHRKGVDTNWEALERNLQKELLKQARVPESTDEQTILRATSTAKVYRPAEQEPGGHRPGGDETSKLTVEQILELWLVERFFDGLCAPGCVGCRVGSLADCGSDSLLDCKPGVLGADAGDYNIYPKEEGS